MTSRSLTTPKSFVWLKKQVSSNNDKMGTIGTKDEYEDLAEVSGQLFEYEYPVKKKEDPVV